MTSPESSTTSARTYDTLTPAQIAALVADAQGWQPKDGDECEGVVLSVKLGFSDVKQANYPILFVLTDNGETVAVHCFQTVLENEARQQRPMPGERIYIKRIGEGGESKKKGYSPTIRYAMHVTREGSNNPWEHMQ